MDMVFNEWYGEIPRTLNAALKRYNVSPSDFGELTYVHDDNWAIIEKVIKNPAYRMGRSFSVYLWKTARLDGHSL